jgi:fluoroacetyl-CoA thioesterase
MDTIATIKTGMTNEAQFVVEEQHLAQHIGSGAIRVLSTPSMIGFMERVSLLLLARALPENLSSVGTRVDVRHLSPTPLGATVRVRAEVTAVEGNKITLAVQAWDEQDLIGEGQHYRVVIDLERFMKRVSAKTGSK